MSTAPWPRDKMDAWEGALDRVFRPGTFIPDRACAGFVADLRELESEVRQGVAEVPDQSVARYEDLLAACYAKTGEMDDSSDSLGNFVEACFCGWALARQAAAADPGETAALLLGWMEGDSHGYCRHLEREVIKVLAPEERLAFRRGIQARAGAGEDGRLQAPGSAPSRWVEALRATYQAEGQVEAFAALAESAGLRTADCRDLAEMLWARGEAQAALAWVDQGLALDQSSWGRHDLSGLRRDLLVELGRREEALQLAWADFAASPNRYSLGDLEPLIPEEARETWRDRILEVVEAAPLHPRLEMFLNLQEVDRVARAVGQAVDADLADLSHTLGEPVAALLDAEFPALAARVWLAQALRILHAKRSRYYDVAVLDLGKARDGLLRAGQGETWVRLVAELRTEHKRKMGFMADFERLVAGVTLEPQPTFLERARDQWQKGRRL